VHWLGNTIVVELYEAIVKAWAGHAWMPFGLGLAVGANIMKQMSWKWKIPSPISLVILGMCWMQTLMLWCAAQTYKSHQGQNLRRLNGILFPDVYYCLFVTVKEYFLMPPQNVPCVHSCQNGMQFFPCDICVMLFKWPAVTKPSTNPISSLSLISKDVCK